MVSPNKPKVTGRHRDTLRQIFAHPMSHNVEWHDVVALLREVASVEERHDGKIDVKTADRSFVLSRSRGKDLVPDELMEVRHLLEALGYSEG